MERPGVLKYYAGAAILVILIIAIAIISHSTTPTVAPQSQTANTAIATSTPSTATTSVANSAAANDLVGTWSSAMAGKGVQGSGKVTVSGTSYQISLNGDVTLVIQKIENGSAMGTIAYNNLCLTTIVTAPGKSPVTKPAQCTSSAAIPAAIQVSGSTLTFSGKSELGSDITFNGSFASGHITGTFTRESQYGKVSGSFDLVRK